MLRSLSKIANSLSASKGNPFKSIEKEIKIGGDKYRYFSLPDLKDKRIGKLPFSIRVLLESAVRNCDETNIKTGDVEKILDWKVNSEKDVEIPFKPARVMLHDFSGTPVLMDLAAMRDVMSKLGGDPQKINPVCPVDLIIDHSVIAEKTRTLDAANRNVEIEFQRNSERFEFLKWSQSAFDNLLIVPPGSGICHQVNLEYIARVVFNKDGVLYPDSLVGTDSHTPMINALGVLGWGVGGIEAEAVMLDQVISMLLPQVVGFKLTGRLPETATATDLVLTVTQMLRKRGVVGKFIEFYGPGCNNLTLSDRATISNMAPEYGATVGFFPVDEKTLEYLDTTNRSPKAINLVQEYLTAQDLFRKYDGSQEDPQYSGESLELDLKSVEPSVSGPKRPHDRVPMSQQKKDWSTCLSGKQGFKGFGIKSKDKEKSVEFDFKGEKYELTHGSVVISAITSCTNTSNPEVMLGAGLLARNAVKAGLKTKPYIKTSLSPGSGVVTKYLDEAELSEYLDQLGYTTAGYGCMTCIGNSGELYQEVADVVTGEDIVAAAVLSGNRNYEGRVHPLTKANYLASPMFVIAYALAGTVNFDFEKDPLGKNDEGKEIFLKDIWPSKEEINKEINECVKKEHFKDIYSKISKGTIGWNDINVVESKLFDWKEDSTYINYPSYLQDIKTEPPKISSIKDAYCLLNLGDTVTTDHISPGGQIPKDSPAGKYLIGKGIEKRDFNSFGLRRGSEEVMMRGTFGSNRIVNKMAEKAGPQTIHVPSGKEMHVYEAVVKYQEEGNPLIVLAGQEYGSGSSRDWAAKGPYIQGVRVVIAQSYERIHRSNLVGMGILPLEFKNDESADSLGLTGKEKFNIKIDAENLKVGQDIEVEANGKKFTTKTRIDTEIEVEYYKNGGILPYVLRKLSSESSA